MRLMVREAGRRLSIALILTGLATTGLVCQPRLVVDTPSSYQVGDRIDLSSLVMDSEGQSHPLQEIIRPNAKVVVVIVFGGAYYTRPNEEKFRGTLWCRDSFDDLGIQRALVRRFQEEPVQFLPIAVPPVYKPETYGWPGDPFLGKADDEEEYRSAVATFIEATEREKNSGLLPFDTIYYDPKFRLAQNRKERELGPEFGTIYEWQGKLKWQNDPRRYGTPTIWILKGDGTVATEPLTGNDYDSAPPDIHYGYAEASATIEKALTDSEGT